MFDFKKIAAAAVFGFLGAAIADLDAWRAGVKTVDGVYVWPSFDFKKAVPRWVAGAIAGVMGGLGLGV